MREKIHPTWHFTASCIGVLIGVVSALWVEGVSSMLLLFAGLLFCLMASALQRRFLLILALLAGCMIGLWRGGVDQRALAVYQPLYNKHVEIVGKVADDIEKNNRGDTTIRLVNNSLDDRPLVGEIWVTVSSSNAVNIRRSDHVRVDGKLESGFGSYAASLTDATISEAKREQPGDLALVVRDEFSLAVARAIHEPASSLGTGYLLGQKSELPQELLQALQVAGLTHIVVASGYNLTILVRFGRRLFERVSKYLSALTGATLIIGFVAVTGLSPSMTRAGLVAGLALWAWYYGRKFHPVTLLTFAAAVTVLVNPSYVWGNVGWQLSFAAFAGVMIVAPLMSAYFFGNEKQPAMVQIMFETFSAQVATLPIILFIFGKFSAIAIVSNLIILPFVPTAMLLTFGAGLVSLMAPGWATLAGRPAQLILDGMIAVVRWCADIPWAQTDWQLSMAGVVTWYLLLGIACWYMQRASGYRLRQASIVE